MENEDWEEFKIKRDNEPDLEFFGKQLAGASSKTNDSTRWYVYRLYETKGGKFIAKRIGRSLWQGEEDRHSAAICATHAEVIKFFGFDDTAKELYSEAGIDAVERVE